MARATDAEVRAIIPSTSISDLTPYINSASIMVDKVAAKSCGKSLTSAELKEGEIWLAAHLANAEDPQVSRERFEQAEKTYQVGNRQMFGIMTDIYGQTANAILNGCLLELDKRKVSIKAVAGRSI